MSGFRLRAYEDSRGWLKGLLCSKPFTYCEPIQPGHFHVYKNQIKLNTFGLFEPALTVLCRHDPIPFSFQDIPEYPPSKECVVFIKRWTMLKCIGSSLVFPVIRKSGGGCMRHGETGDLRNL